MVVYNDFDQGEFWTDKFAVQHPIAQMGTAHRIYSARMLDRMAVECAMVYSEDHPIGQVWDYATDADYEAAELQEWLREHDPNEWVQSTVLYRALMDLPEPLPEEDRDDNDHFSEEGRPLPVDGDLLLREEIVAGEEVGGSADRDDDGRLVGQAPAGDGQDAERVPAGES